MILCERGIRTFETATRNTLDVSAIAVLREKTDLPIAVDPGHAAGKAAGSRRSRRRARRGRGRAHHRVPPEPGGVDVRRRAGDHPRGARAHRRGRSCARRDDTAAVGEFVGECRAVIDTIDDAVFQMLEYRAAMVEAVQQRKASAAIPVRDARRERQTSNGWPSARLASVATGSTGRAGDHRRMSRRRLVRDCSAGPDGAPLHRSDTMLSG